MKKLLDQSESEYSTPASLHKRHTSKVVPAFSLPVLGSDSPLRNTDLVGKSTVLFFASAHGFVEEHYKGFAAALRVRWQSTEGQIYLIWDGDSESCRTFLRRYAIGFPEERILMDSSRHLFKGLDVTETPCAVELDRSGRVHRYGRPTTLEAESQYMGTSRGYDQQMERTDWSQTSGAGFSRLNSDVSCIITRFQLRSPVFLIPFYFSYRRVKREAESSRGLLKSAFLIENAHTCYTLSIWSDDSAILHFGGLREHVRAANAAFGPTYRKDKQRHEIWSAQFRLWALSAHNQNWDGLDLTELSPDPSSKELFTYATRTA